MDELKRVLDDRPAGQRRREHPAGEQLRRGYRYGALLQTPDPELAGRPVIAQPAAAAAGRTQGRQAFAGHGAVKSQWRGVRQSRTSNHDFRPVLPDTRDIQHSAAAHCRRKLVLHIAGGGQVGTGAWPVFDRLPVMRTAVVTVSCLLEDKPRAIDHAQDRFSPKRFRHRALFHLPGARIPWPQRLGFWPGGAVARLDEAEHAAVLNPGAAVGGNYRTLHLGRIENSGDVEAAWLN
jgi:hypothetical protein